MAANDNHYTTFIALLELLGVKPEVAKAIRHLRKMLNPLYDWLLKAIANLKHQPFSTQKQGFEIIYVENQAEIAS